MIFSNQHIAYKIIFLGKIGSYFLYSMIYITLTIVPKQAFLNFNIANVGRISVAYGVAWGCARVNASDRRLGMVHARVIFVKPCDLLIISITIRALWAIRAV